MMKAIILKLTRTAALVLLTAVGSSAQIPDTLWTQTLGLPFEYGKEIRSTADNGAIVTGQGQTSGHHRPYLLKIDENGAEEWHRFYGEGIGSSGAGNSARQTTDGGYVLAGSNSHDIATDGYLAKTDAAGRMLWQRTYGGASSDYFLSVDQTLDGGYAAAGYTYSYGNGSQMWLVKTDANGDTLWTRAFGGMYTDQGYSVQATFDGGCVVAGHTIYSNDYDAYVVKTDSSGNTEWERWIWGTTATWYRSVRHMPDGGYILAGSTAVPYGNTSPWLVRMNPQGDTLWTQVFGSTGFQDFGFCAIPTYDGGFALTGSQAFPQYVSGGAMSLWKTDSLGNVIWQYTLGDTGVHNEGHFLDQASNGDYLVTGGDYYTTSSHWLARFRGEALRATLTPHHPPIVIPAQGGSFTYDVEIENLSNWPFAIDVLIDITLPGGGNLPVRSVQNHALGVQSSLMRTNLVQTVPGTALPGLYYYNLHVRDHNTWEWLAEDTFPFTKAGSEDLRQRPGDWISESSDWPLDSKGWLNAAVEIGSQPLTISSLTTTPNPFNPSTVARFELRVASLVNLKVYDTAGRLIRTLADGRREAGVHEVALDGSGLATGVYFLALRAEGQTQTHKILLVK